MKLKWKEYIINYLEIKKTNIIEANGDDRMEELADMLEVIRELASLENKNFNDVIDIADKKMKKRGAFNEKVIESE